MRVNIMTLTLGTVGVVLFAACGGSTSPYGGGGGGGGGGACTPTASKVCMTAVAFNPTDLTITAGTMVTWQNGSAVTHTVSSATGSTQTYDSGNIPSGGTYSQTFNTAGTYDYYCKFHGTNGTPPTGMSGTITVNP